MDLNTNLEHIQHLLATFLNANVTEKDGVLQLDDQEAIGPSIAEIDRLLAELAPYESDGAAAIYTATDFEVLVREEASFLAPGLARRGAWPYRLEDPDQRLTYTLGPPSDHYLLFLIHRLAALGPQEGFFGLRRRGYRLGTIPGPMEEEKSESAYTLFGALRDSMRRIYSLRIQSESPLTLKILRQAADSFSFQLAYNLDTAFVSIRSFEEVVRRTRLRRIRRPRPEDLDAPRRIYNSDLVSHYQMGVATDSPPLEYLSYYHVAEHFFEAVFEDDLISSVRTTLTQPDFSFRRKADVRALIKLVRDKLRFQREDVTFSEQEALRLVLDRYVDIESIRDKLDAIQDSLVPYYAEKPIVFADSGTVDLREADSSKTTAALSRRIYATRNAVVHSKDGGKPKYVPFRHDRVLAQELPLMRLVAEEIIISSSDLPT
ncbi:MAG: hypothetical protein F4Z04_06425 [Acidobacteria bacterium]|nr:hypothetical protein [Acidobacteriota bacterium]